MIGAGLAIVAACATMARAEPAPIPPDGPGSYSRRVWQTSEGLPEDYVHAFAQTPDGYLWIGTSGGLVRFDSVRFVVFNSGNEPAFQDDSIYTLRVARDGSLWAGTEGGGLVRYRGGTLPQLRRQGRPHQPLRPVGVRGSTRDAVGRHRPGPVPDGRRGAGPLRRAQRRAGGQRRLDHRRSRRTTARRRRRPARAGRREGRAVPLERHARRQQHPDDSRGVGRHDLDRDGLGPASPARRDPRRPVRRASADRSHQRQLPVAGTPRRDVGRHLRGRPDPRTTPAASCGSRRRPRCLTTTCSRSWRMPRRTSGSAPRAA